MLCLLYLAFCCCFEKSGQTALMMATQVEHDECFSRIIAGGADVNMVNKVVA